MPKSKIKNEKPKIQFHHKEKLKMRNSKTNYAKKRNLKNKKLKF